jgi:hypothetical protein
LSTQKAQLTHSDITLDPGQVAEARDSWTDEAAPVQRLIAFDFAVLGTPLGTRSRGLAALVGQEVTGWPPDKTLRPVCARRVVRLAHDMLLHGLIIGEQLFPAPDIPQGQVTLVLHHVPQQ